MDIRHDSDELYEKHEFQRSNKVNDMNHSKVQLPKIQLPKVQLPKIQLHCVLIGALVVSLFISACSPMTPVRRSLYAPRPALPARIGAPLETGQLRAFGQINSAGFKDSEDGNPILPNSQVGDPGVLTPRLQIGAGAYLGLSEFLEIGGQFTYSHMQWTNANVTGVLPFPEGESRNLIIAGLGARINAPLADGMFAISFLAELNVGSLPQAYFECVHSACENSDRTSWTADQGTTYYRLDRIAHERVFLPQGAFHFTYSPADFIGVFALMGLQGNYRNIGFDADADSLNDDSLDMYLISTAGAGVDVQIEPLTITGAAFFPVHYDKRIPIGPSLVIQAGLSF
ncbi:MAG: hypothetical protein ACNA8W_04580 [Bradymonadaceae bacterium]